MIPQDSETNGRVVTDEPRIRVSTLLKAVTVTHV